MRVDAGTVIEHAECHGCGRDVLVKANKNGMAYYYCNGQAEGAEGGCSHHEKWSRAKSQEKVAAYYRAMREDKTEGVKSSAEHTEQPKVEDAKPAEVKPGGFSRFLGGGSAFD